MSHSKSNGTKWFPDSQLNLIHSDPNLAAKEKEVTKERAPEAAAVDHALPAGHSDFEKKKKKDYTAEYGSQGSGGTSSFTSADRAEEAEQYERKKKKDYDYEALFQKQETGSTNDTRLRQAYQTQQAYRSVSTSGSRSSLDADSADVRSDSSLSKTGSQEVGKVKSEAKVKKTKGRSFGC